VLAAHRHDDDLVVRPPSSWLQSRACRWSRRPSLMLNNGPDGAEDTENGGDISGAPFEAMKDVHLAAAFLSNGGGATPVALRPKACEQP
jgi:hypothetical protein